MRLVAAATSVLSLVGASLVLTSGPGVADPGVDLGGLPPGGTVTIQTGLSGGAGQVVSILKDQNGVDQPAVVQRVANNSCDALETGPLSISALEGQACYGNRGFGVDPGREGGPWFLNPNTSSNEKLVVALNEAGYVFLGDVSLDIEAVGSAPEVAVTTKLSGDVVESFSVPLVNRVVRWPPNYRESVTLTQGADTIEFTAVGDTLFQLEGDSNNRQGSALPLRRATDVVPCDGGTVNLANGATLTVNGGPDCVDEPIVFEVNDDGEVLLLKEPSDAEYDLRLPFRDGDDPLARVEIDYDSDGPSPYQDVNFCDDTASPALRMDENPLTPDTGVESWDGFCEAGRSYEIVAGEFLVTVDLFGVNDPRFRFR